MHTLQLEQFSHYLKPRPRDWHKGNAGHVLVIGGDHGYSGAARMAAEAALRVGAGLVSIISHPDHAALLNLTRPEIMCHSPAELSYLLSKIDVIVFGPGLGARTFGHELFDSVIKIGADKPCILDADALNILAEKNIKNSNWILTPHPGEAARLLKTTVQAVQEDRLQAVISLQKKWGGVAVLKGAGTWIAAPNLSPVQCINGNPGMASGGMGDILSGVIGGWMAQGVPLANAAKLGVLIHAMAGDLAAKEGERGMIATDLMPYLRRLSNAD